MSYDDEANLELLRATTGGLPYKPPSYTCIKEFTDSFPQQKAPEFVSEPSIAKPAFILEAPYPKIYNNTYKTTILTILK